MLPNFPTNPVAGATYTINGLSFVYRVTGGRGEFVAKATGGGGGIVYSDVLPLQVAEGVTYFNADLMEHVYSYNDGNSLQHLAVPLLAGSGGATVSGSGGGLSTIATASANGNTLVATTNTNENHRVKSIIAGTGLKATATGTELTLNVDLTDSTSATGNGLVIDTDGTAGAKKQIKKLKAGTGITIGADADSLTISSTGGGGSGSGSGIIYTDVLPAVKVENATYFNHSTAELVTTYNDGDSLQYLAYPMNGYGAVGGSGSGGSSFTFVQLGSEGSTFFSYNGLDVYSFKRLRVGASATLRIADDGTAITLDALDVVAPAVAGATLVGAKTATTQPIKRIVAGTNITLTETASAVTINASGGSGATLNDSLTRINALTPVNNSMMVWTGAGVANVPTTASTRAMLGLDTVGNTLAMFTGASTATLIACTPYIVSLLATTGVPNALAHLGVTSGSNANGNWLRIATGGSSGIQICWHTIVCNGATVAHGSGFIGAEATWTYPQSFAAVPSVAPTVRDGVAAMIINGSAGYSTSSATFRQLAFLASVNAAVVVLAVGYY
jgi:hypothetical protein